MKTSPWFLAAALLMVPASADAQEKDVTFGIGVGLNPVAIVADDITDLFLPVGLGNIYFPLVIGNFKLEPEFGIARFSSSFSGAGFSRKETATALRAGIGFSYVGTTAENRARRDRQEDWFRFYVGPRVGIVRLSSSSEFSGPGFPLDERSESQTNLVLELATGGEYLFSSHFSLGGEVRVSYISIGDVKETPGPPAGGGELSESILTTSALVLLRWYF